MLNIAVPAPLLEFHFRWGSSRSSQRHDGGSTWMGRARMFCFLVACRPPGADQVDGILSS
uniref:Uncharacterized protein n=1 Tax=Setaria viridis TaxID=4556 RepID=A0A4U6UQ91_SETVI|nr:hypothetical protein SEVIR_5G075400v2 [Setaria viridis]